MPSPRTPKLRLPSRATQICRFTGQPWVWDPASTPLVPHVLHPPRRSPRGFLFSKHPRRVRLPHQVGKRGRNDQAGGARREHPVQRSESSTPAACRLRLQVGDELGHDLCCRLWLSGEPNALPGPL